jgi:hypothetical protein
METNRQRRCSGCDESGHNIRSCITHLDKTLIEEYSEHSFNEFPTHFIIGNKLNRLCQKYGLYYSNNVTDNQKKERLHTIYFSLGRQHRRNMINQLYLQQRQINIYRPSYLPPLTSPVLVQRRSRFLDYLFYLQQRQPDDDIIIPPTNPNPNPNPNIKPSLHIVVNPSKFKNTDVLECPICYEECCNMLVTDCNHSYCQPCISSFMNTVNKNTLPCPLCRENIRNVYTFSESSSDLMLQN